MLYVFLQQVFLLRFLVFESFDRSLLFAALHPKLFQTKTFEMGRQRKGKQPVVLTGLLEAQLLW